MTNEMAASTSATATTVNLVWNISMIEPKLESSNNCSTWKFLMKMTLMIIDLWECVTSDSSNRDAKYKIKSVNYNLSIIRINFLSCPFKKCRDCERCLN